MAAAEGCDSCCSVTGAQGSLQCAHAATLGHLAGGQLPRQHSKAVDVGSLVHTRLSHQLPMCAVSLGGGATHAVPTALPGSSRHQQGLASCSAVLQHMPAVQQGRRAMHAMRSVPRRGSQQSKVHTLKVWEPAGRMCRPKCVVYTVWSVLASGNWPGLFCPGDASAHEHGPACTDAGAYQLWRTPCKHSDRSACVPDCSE